MSFSIGIVGLPNVGKSTLFTALTKKQVNVSNYPFCTIEPNVGVVAVPDERLNKLAELLKPEKVLPTTIEFVDIAGLVKNAHQGEGLGNQFLSRIREVDAILQVVRDFKDDNVSHVHGEINPQSDIEVVNLELILADLQIVAKRLEKLRKQAKGSTDKTLQKNIQLLERLTKTFERGQMASTLEFDDDEQLMLKELNLLTLKPILYIYNIDEDEINKPKFVPSKAEGTYDLRPSLTISAKFEADLVSLNDNEAKEYLESMNIKQTGLDQLIFQSYNLLNLITFYTSQNNILQAWTIPQGTKAPQAAGKIHGDFEKGFIKAEVINYNDLIKTGSEAKAKEKGLIRTEGKNYPMQDGDVAYFLFNVYKY